MASTYPAALDSYTAVTSTTLITSTTPGRTFVQFINDHGDAIEKIEAELGLTPSSTHATVTARLSALDTTVSAKAPATIAPSAAADGAWVGPKVTLAAGETLSLGSVCRLSTAGKCVKADADAIATASAQFIALSTFAANSSGSFGMPGGFLHAASLFNFTVGGLVYLSTTAGAVKQTVSSGASDVVQVIGVATHADKLYFNPSLTQVEV